MKVKGYYGELAWPESMVYIDMIQDRVVLEVTAHTAFRDEEAFQAMLGKIDEVVREYLEVQ